MPRKKFKKVLFIYNPKSGREMIKTKLSQIVMEFCSHEYMLTVLETQKQHDCTNWVKRFGKKYDLIVVSGGDGTMNEMVTGLMQIPIEARPKCGYIPAGTVNDFAASLHIPKNMQKAAELITNENFFFCDVGKFNDKYFTYVAAFGIFTDVAYTTSQDLKNTLGKMAYFIEALKRLGEIEPHHIKIEHDGTVEEGSFILGLVTNSESIGSIKAYSKKHIKMDDGLFEAAFIRELKNPIELQNVLNAIINKSLDSPYILRFESHDIKITSDEDIKWTIDGEDGGRYSEVNVSILDKAMNIACDLENDTEFTDDDYIEENGSEEEIQERKK